MLVRWRVMIPSDCVIELTTRLIRLSGQCFLDQSGAIYSFHSAGNNSITPFIAGDIELVEALSISLDNHYSDTDLRSGGHYSEGELATTRISGLCWCLQPVL